MITESKDLLNKFYNENKDSFPELSIERFREICHFPWKYLKNEIENDELNAVRFKYFGIFTVHKGRAMGLLNTLEKQFNKKQITIEYYNRIKTMIVNYLNKINNEI